MTTLYETNKGKIYAVFSAIISILVLTLFFANGTLLSSKNNTISYDFSKIDLKNTRFIKLENNQITFLEGINESNYIEFLGLNFNSDLEEIIEEIDFDKLDNYSVKLILNLKKTKNYLNTTQGENLFYIGFSDYSQVAFNKNYLEINSDKSKINIIHWGEELSGSYSDNSNKNENKIILEYFIDNKNNIIKYKIQANGKKYEKQANLKEEYVKGFKPDNFWLTVTKTDSVQFEIEELSINKES